MILWTTYWPWQSYYITLHILIDVISLQYLYKFHKALVMANILILYYPMT